MVTTSPTLARRHVGEQLERLRSRAKVTRTEAARYIGKTPETIRRWERGQVPVNVSYIRDFCRLYNASSTLLARLTSLAVDAKTPGLFEAPNVPMEHMVLWENEVVAQSIHSVELVYIPGLMQTPEYQREVQNRQVRSSADVEANARKMRSKRQQQVFEQSNPPSMEFYIGRAAIDCMEEFPRVRDQQLAKLRRLATNPNLGISVMTGLHASMMGSFHMITPPVESLAAGPFVYLESAHGATYEESPEVVAIFSRILSAVSETAIPLEEYLK